MIEKNQEINLLSREKNTLENQMKDIDELYIFLKNMSEDHFLLTQLCNNNNISNLDNNILMKDDYIKKLDNIKILQLKGVIYLKIATAINNQINITLEVQNEITKISMQVYDIVVIVGNLIDYAIEEAKKTEDKEVTISLASFAEYVKISISNSSLETDGNFESYNNNVNMPQNKMTKILNKYTNIMTSISCQNYIFTNTLEISKVYTYNKIILSDI